MGQLQRIGYIRLGPLPLSELIERGIVDVFHKALVADANRFARIRPPHEFPKQTDTAIDARLESYIALVDENRASDRWGIDGRERSIDRRCVPDESFDEHPVHQARGFTACVHACGTTEQSDGRQRGDDGLEMVVVARYRAGWERVDLHETPRELLDDIGGRPPMPR